jgi:glycosyltransferase involved in cell wall biosynthesis
MTPFISVICPTYNEEKYIAQCIDSLLQQDYPLNQLEILFVDGMSTDRTREIIKQYIARYPFIRLLDNPDRVVPHAMNIGIEHALGSIILRIDAHSFFPTNYFVTLADNLIRLNADNVGVACKTDVLNKTPKTLAIREVLSNPLGVGNSLFRIGIDKITEVDTVPFGCYKKEVFQKYGLYNEKLVRNQDIELNKRIKRGGGKILLIPDTYCIYYARETFRALMKNNYQNGKWNILTVYYTGMFESLSIRHFVPVMFVLSLLLPLIFSFFYFPAGLFALLSALIYLILIFTISIKTALAKKLSIPCLVAAFILLHLSYGAGSLKGLFRVALLKISK